MARRGRGLGRGRKGRGTHTAIRTTFTPAFGKGRKGRRSGKSR